jgi:AcrR family transcriptional regulator
VQQRSRQTVADVLEGAARIFDREGLDATTNRIAEEAGVSIGTLYEYFPDKRALLVALGEHHLESACADVDALCERWSSSPPPSGVVAVDEMVALMLERHTRHRSMHQLLTTVIPDAPELLARAMAMQAQLVHALAMVLAQTEPPPGDVDVCAEMIVLVCAELTHGPLLRATPEDRARWTSHLRMLVRGYLHERVP